MRNLLPSLRRSPKPLAPCFVSRLACLDHIPSACPYTLPLAEIVPMLRDAGVQQVFVDGAHVPGQMDVDVPALGVDFYTGNLHKWCYCPPAVAFLYVASECATNPWSLLRPFGCSATD